MNDVRLSKLLSLVLRHQPETIGVELDQSGWVPVDDVIEGLAQHGFRVDRAQLERVVASSDKQRFALDHSSNRIRANQGHSVAVDLGLAPAVPPDLLFHGTPSRNLASILESGLLAGQRHAVHLSADEATAHRVGARRGEHLVLVVDARQMRADGHLFYVSDNGVWLTDTVAPNYVRPLGQ